MNSSERQHRRFEDVVPGPFEGLQANCCRNPACPSYGVPPLKLNDGAERPSEKVGLYSLHGSLEDTRLICRTCRKLSRPFSNEGLSMEIKRLRTANGLLAVESCPRKSCKNHGKSVTEFPSEYYAHGKTPSGAVRKRCRRCRKAFTLGDHRRRPTAGSVNRDIVRDIVNRASLNAILRKLKMNPATLYERIDFIHQQMVAFEAFKMRAFRRSGWKRKFYALATDAQDYRVNWQSRDRRVEIQLSAITTTENITGFILRSDVNFDPTSGDVVATVIPLLESGELDDPGNLKASHRLVIPSLLRAAAHVLKSGKNLSKLPLGKRRELLHAIEDLLPKYNSEKDPGSDCAINGTLIRKLYTATAHFRLIAEMLPRDAEFHLMMDCEGAFVPSVLTGYVEALKERRADLTYMAFDKDLSNPKKKSLVAAFKRDMEQFIEEVGSMESPTDLRRAFIARFANKLGNHSNGVYASWWSIPIATMYEPNKQVGIFYQRPLPTPEATEERRLALLDRTSLHSVDSFFNVLRARMSYFHRPGHSRSSGGHYGPFQPYNPEMVQKMLDISRVWFNWCEARAFRLAKKFNALDPQPHDPWHDKIDNAFEEQKRRTRREEFTTPAMRMYLAESEIRLETILYTDWLTKLSESGKRKRRRRSNGGSGVTSSGEKKPVDRVGDIPF